MKREDFERLKAVCKKEGYLIRNEDPWDGSTFVITKKESWEGVEFAECVDDIGGKPNIIKGRIYKIVKGNNIDCLYFIINESGKEDGWSDNRSHFKPSTESAYVEQLKKEAFERFGDIKEGDRFDRTSINLSLFTGQIPYNQHFKGVGFKYFKINDSLEFAGIKIYQQGKWAERVKERVEVDFIWSERKLLGEKMVVVGFHDKKKYESDEMIVESVFVGKKDKEIAEIFTFLAEQLEKYLNNEL